MCCTLELRASCFSEGDGLKKVSRNDPGFPSVFLEREGGPGAIYLIGDETILEMAPQRVVAIVGTREASPYGVKVTTALARAFAEAGIAVASGLARGIDAAAHRGALEAGGKTIAVMGTGVDVPYPVGHRELHREVGEKGLVLSENPPGMTAFPGCFPRRNRLIAALARVTIVVEAPYKSGAINTATQALDAGRVVAAVPGPIDSPKSAGANLLLRDGAQFIHSVDDALMLYGLTVGRKPERAVLGTAEAAVWAALEEGQASAEVLADRSGLEVRSVLEGIARLELNGMVRQTAGGAVERAAIG